MVITNAKQWPQGNGYIHSPTERPILPIYLVNIGHMRMHIITLTEHLRFMVEIQRSDSKAIANNIMSMILAYIGTLATMTTCTKMIIVWTMTMTTLTMSTRMA